jgi:uncharacterized protein YecA (UPF0149 family)
MSTDIHPDKIIERIAERMGNAMSKKHFGITMGLRQGPSAPWKRKKPKVGRNERCPCGSGKKYKKCCIGNQ